MTNELSDRPATARRPIPTWAKVVGTAIAGVVLAGSFVGVGMAVQSPSTSRMNMSSATSADSSTTGGHSGEAAAARRAWAHTYGVDRATMPNLAPVAEATPAQQAAATALLSATEADTAKYANVSVAEAAGYDLPAALARAEKKHPGLAMRLARVDAGTVPTAGRMPMLHVANPAFRKDGKVLDPTAPETLMYQYLGHGTWKLIGVMYVANEAYPSAPPDPGGPITRWHYHDKSGGRSLMMHIFFVPDLAHAYAAEMSLR